MMSCRVIVLAKAPQPGLAKTRFIPILGAAGAARLARGLLELRIRELARAPDLEMELWVTPEPSDPAWRALGLENVTHWRGQGEGDLGQRMARAAAAALDVADGVLLIGTDCPALDCDGIRAAGTALAQHDAVLVPASDGGYVLLGLRRFHPSLFSDLPWGGSKVAAMTLARIAALGWSVKVFEALPDIDRPEDLALLPEALSEFRIAAGEPERSSDKTI